MRLLVFKQSLCRETETTPDVIFSNYKQRKKIVLYIYGHINRTRSTPHIVMHLTAMLLLRLNFGSMHYSIHALSAMTLLAR